MSFQAIEGLGISVEVGVLGPIDNNCFIFSGPTADTERAEADEVMVVDPAADADAILAAVGERNIAAIVITHAHWDHFGAAERLRAAAGCPVYASAVDALRIEQPTDEAAVPCPVDVRLSDGDVVEAAGLVWRTIATPGHTKGGICLHLEAPRVPGAPGLLVSGDTLFAGCIGRVDFEGGDMDEMRASLRTLAQLPDDTIVLPGHYGPTSIGAERRRVFDFYA